MCASYAEFAGCLPLWQLLDGTSIVISRLNYPWGGIRQTKKNTYNNSKKVNDSKVSAEKKCRKVRVWKSVEYEERVIETTTATATNGF